ncbi:hypothetical protein FACS189493_0370 [Spirochaetia bacterium]|nr:hypothetical protein FACS189493_0370 [Spirochaetia bacterium]
MKKIYRSITTAIIATVLLSVSSCKQLDVIGKESKTSFGEVLTARSGAIGVDAVTGGWTLPAPDGSAAFVWVPDFSKGTTRDVMLVFDIRPFLAAGLDVNRLPDSITVLNDKIIVGTKLGDEEAAYTGEPTPLSSFERIVDLKRSSIGYHAALDHYGVDLTGGFMFEWAKDMNTNDKDIVFVLNPEPFIAAGVDPAKIDGWVFTTVPTMDSKGRKIEVEKILKPVNLL